jgi:hypothetical protein
MATVLEAVLQKSSALLWFFLWAKGHAKDIHKEMFAAYGGKGLSPKAVHNWVKKYGKHFVDGEGLKQRFGSG